MKPILTLLILFIAPLSFSCDEISGVYKTNSESHWSYTLSISGADLHVNYSNYWYGGDGEKYGEERYEVDSNFTGYCQKQGAKYLLKFNDQEVLFSFNNTNANAIASDQVQPSLSGAIAGDHVVTLYKAY